MIKGSKQTVQVQTLLTLAKNNKPTSAEVVKEKYQPEVKEEEGKPGFIAGILALKRL